MLAFFDRDIFRPHPPERAPRPDQAGVAGHHSRFAVVQDEQVDPREERVEIFPGRLNPEIHRVGHDKTRPAHLVEDVGLQRRRDVGQEHKLRFAKILRQLGLEIFEDIERDRFCFAGVEIPGVFARPAERLARDLLHSGRIDVARFPEIEFRFWKIIADHSDEIDRSKKAGADRGVGSGTAELIGVFFDRGFDGVEGNGSNYENRHGFLRFRFRFG